MSVDRQSAILFQPHSKDGWLTYPFLLDMPLQDTARQEAGDFGDLRDILVSVVAHQKKDEDIAVCAEAGVAFSGVRHEVLGGLIRLDETLNTNAVILVEVVQCFYPLGCVVYVG